jgi:DNA-binding NtrC family response regulator
MLDERIAGEDTLDLLAELDLSRVMEIYLMSGERSLDRATQAMELGITGYFRKPVDRDDLAERLRELETHAGSEAHEVDEAGKTGRGLLVGDSPPMHRLYRLIRKSAPSAATILIIGESGVGKELVAQSIHELSRRASDPFVACNCSAISPELLESELFGHEKGSFTGASRDHQGYFERAAGGTLFLDEITEMDAGLQAKLLRVLEEKRIRRVGAEQDIDVDVRIIAATNKEPHAAVEQGKLRLDLYYRLAQFPIRVPGLRERGEDIVLLAQHFLERECEKSGIGKAFSSETLDVLKLHDWPGNVRELKNAVMHGYILAGGEILPDDLPYGIPSSLPVSTDVVRLSFGLSLDEVERRYTLSTLARLEGDKKATAESLGISLKTLYNRLKKYDADKR